MRILVVEDDESTAKALTVVLSHQNYTVEVATDGQAAWELVDRYAFDLVLLDVMIPRVDGITLCRRLRSQGCQTPILLLTGRDSGHDKAIGLDAGADDYVVKPFDPEELVARIRALLRRGTNTVQPVLEWGKLRLDPSSCEVTYQNKLLALTPKEYALLELFLRNHRRVFSCGVILEQIWSFEEMPGEEAVRTHIKGLRHKLKVVGAPADLVETVYGVGYRLKPLESATNGSVPSPKTPPGESVQQQTAAALAKVWDKYHDRISRQIEVILQAVFGGHPIPGDLQQQAIQEAHSLAGALGTFGFPQGSQLARKIEQLLQSDRELGEQELGYLQNLVTTLQREVALPPGKPDPIPSPCLDERPVIVIVDSDRASTLVLTEEAENWGLRVVFFANLPSAREYLKLNSPALVLLDLTVSADRQEGIALIADLNQRQPSIPVFVFSAHNDLDDRLEVARQGGRAFLHKSSTPAQVMAAITRTLHQGNAGEAKVLAVDDDPQILATLRTLLEPWGLHITTLEDPQRFWDTLEATTPDLLLLDIRMPGLSGVDLCRVVRNDSRWSDLPVIFLTAHSDGETVNQVFAVGADDFVSKPIVGPELITRIVNRLDRTRMLRCLAETDSLTGVANRYKATQVLDKLLSLARRQQQTLSLAVLDLDHFKQVNDLHGHATGDLVLRQVGQMLQRTFRGEDVVARWGGEEFVVGLYGMKREQGVQRLTQWLQQLHDHIFVSTDQSQFQITCSVGIAEYPRDGADLQSLHRAADGALYQAKAAGRNRVLPASSPTHPEFSISRQ